MSNIKRYVVGPLLGSLLLGGIAMAGTKSKEPPQGYIYKNVMVGHHTERKLVPITYNPGSYMMAVETGRSVAGPGDYWAYKTVGRRQVRVWVHDVSMTPAGRVYSGPCSDCSHRYVPVGHNAQYTDFCMVGNRRVDCSKNPAECPECAKKAGHDTERCDEEVRP